MQSTDLSKHIISAEAPLTDALAALDALSGGVMTLLATDADGRLLGTVTDGDIRRALLRGVALTAKVAEAMHTACTILDGSLPTPAAYIRQLREKGIRLVPMVDAEGRPERIIDTEYVNTVLPISAILMAGGRGRRLSPLTDTTPKPLLPVGGKPVIDYNIEALGRCGVADITVTVNYLAEQLEEHFKERVGGVNVATVREPRALGTIGSASLVNLPEEGDTLVMNSDLLTRIDIEALWRHHTDTGADITVAAIPYNVSVPYAVLTLSGEGREAVITGLEEKPTYSHYANAGIYMISNRLLRALPKDTPTDAPELVEQAIAAGLKVACYPFDAMWIDIGTPADYRHACDIMSKQ